MFVLERLKKFDTNYRQKKSLIFHWGLEVTQSQNIIANIGTNTVTSETIE